MTHPRTVDASRLPGEGFGAASPAWWGTLGFMVIEGSTMLLCAGAYIYLSRRSPSWPPPSIAMPHLLPGTLVVVGLLLSLIPAVLLNRSARTLDRKVVLPILVLSVAVEAVIVVLRAVELKALPMRWDVSAYGSIVWFTLGFHTTLLLFDMLETMAFLALFLWAPLEKKHFADVSDSVMYWFFVSLVWVPLYFLLYVSPRL